MIFKDDRGIRHVMVGGIWTVYDLSVPSLTDGYGAVLLPVIHDTPVANLTPTVSSSLEPTTRFADNHKTPSTKL